MHHASCTQRGAPTRHHYLSLSTLFLGLALAASGWAQNSATPVSETPDLDAIQRAFQGLVEEVSPSVVGLRARKHAAHNYGQQTAADAESYMIVNGSGTILTQDGLILTNDHVVGGAVSIDVLFSDGQRAHGSLFASDPRSDLAIVQVSRKDLTPAKICDWDKVARGQWSVAIGNPFGLGNDGQLSVSIGVISNLGRHLPGLGEIDDRFYNDKVQVTAPINPGNSGGPLFNIHGELVGVVTAMHTRGAIDDGVGFAIPMTPIKHRLVQALCKGDAIEYGYLGVTVRQLDSVERDRLGITYGVAVQRVDADGPAERAGIRPGDFILRYESQPVSGPAHLAELAGQTLVGAAVRVDVRRGTQSSTVQVKVSERNLNRVTWMKGSAVSWRGMRLSDVPQEIPERKRIPASGVVVLEVEKESPASLANIQVGDVIEDIDGDPVPNTVEFLARVRELKGPAEIQLHERGRCEVPPWRKDTPGDSVQVAEITRE